MRIFCQDIFASFLLGAKMHDFFFSERFERPERDCFARLRLEFDSCGLLYSLNSLESDVFLRHEFMISPPQWWKNCPSVSVSSREGVSYRYLLDAYKLERRATYILRADFNDFSDALHKCVEILCLGVATAQGRDCGDVVSILVALDHDGKLAETFHRSILACRRKGPGSGCRGFQVTAELRSTRAGEGLP